MKKIISNVKGIEKLFVQKEDFPKLSQRIQVIYGANGIGKSSFKQAINNDNIKKHWNLQEKESYVCKEIQCSNSATFDERIVSLVRYGNPSTVAIFGKKINSLYGLIINRNEIIKNDSHIINETLLKINTQHIKITIQTLKDIKYIISKKLFIIEKEIDLDINKAILDLIVKKINNALERWWISDIYYDNDSFQYKSNGLLKLMDFFSLIIKNEDHNYLIIKKEALKEVDRTIIFFSKFTFYCGKFWISSIRWSFSKHSRKSSNYKIRWSKR